MDDKSENILAYRFPNLIKEWHPSRNKEISPYDVKPFTHRSVWWKCKDGHEWEAKISNRANGRRCPYCMGKKVCSDNSLQTLNPSLSKEWHPTKNGELTPGDVTQFSEKKVWWLCKKKHEWIACIHNRSRGNNCPSCQKECSTSFPEQALFYFCNKIFLKSLNKYRVGIYEIDIYISELNLGIEYDGYFYHKSEKAFKNDQRKNAFLMREGFNIIRIREKGLPSFEEEGLLEIHYNCNREYNNLNVCIAEVFRNIKENFEISKEVQTRMNKELSEINKEIVKNEILETYISSKDEKSLVELLPKLAKEWHFAKNGGLQPEQFSKGSHYNAWWLCSKNNSHEWSAPIYSRASGVGCPFCSGRRFCESNSLRTINPILSKEWHPVLNGDLTPKDVSYKSKKKVWWICKKGHEWNTRIEHRNNGSGCPFCSGNKVCSDNCLATTHPHVSEEWDYRKNGNLTPNDVLAGSNKKVWWICKSGHEIQRTIYNRVKTNRCSRCKK